MPDSRVEQFRNDGDLNGLVKILRNRADPVLRNEAAIARGTLQDLEAVEPLARAVLQDPDPEVQKTAHQALGQLVGIDTGTVLATYRHHLSTTGKWGEGRADDKNEEYLQDVSVNADEAGMADSIDAGASAGPAQNEALSEWDKQNLDGIITVLSHETNPKIRLQAIRALKNSSNMRAIETLSSIALYDDIPEIRQAAREAMEKRFGEDAAAVINSYRQGSPDEENLDEEQETEDEEPDDVPEVFQGPADIPRTKSSFGDYSPSSVIQEDRIGWKVILLVILVILIVGGVAYLLFFR